jgi:hypothetical protein
LSCSFQEKGNYFLKILLNLDISTIDVYMARKLTSYTQRALQTSTAAVLLNQNVSMWQNCTESHAIRQMTGNLNSFDFIPQSLDAGGVIGVKECILKPWTFVL